MSLSSLERIGLKADQARNAQTAVLFSGAACDAADRAQRTVNVSVRDFEEFCSRPICTFPWECPGREQRR